MKAEEEAREAVTIAFLNAPACRRRRRRLGWSSFESSASRLSDSKEANSSKGSFDGSDSGDDEGEEEEEDDDDEGEKMEYLAPDYPQEDSGMTRKPMCQGLLKLLAVELADVFFFLLLLLLLLLLLCVCVCFFFFFF